MMNEQEHTQLRDGTLTHLIKVRAQVQIYRFDFGGLDWEFELRLVRNLSSGQKLRRQLQTRHTSYILTKNQCVEGFQYL